ncbi:MAG: HEAT repeat domain-containing protein [Candidatus Hodarchaeota archaeon]
MKIRKILIERRIDEAISIIKKEPIALLVVIDALEDPITILRQNAVETLGKIGEKYTRDLLPAVLKDPDPGVRWRAAKALALLGDNRSVKNLSEAIGTGFHDEAILLLAKMGDFAVRHLSKLLETSNEVVRIAVTQALGNIGSKRTIKPLISALNDDSPLVRENAVKILVQIGVPAVEPLVTLLNNTDKVVLKHVIDALVRIGDIRAVKPLIQLLKRECDLQQGIIKALPKFESNHVSKSLIEALNSNDRNICRTIFIALWTIGDEAIEPLLNALENEKEKIRLEILNVIGMIRNDRVKNALIHTLKDPSEKVRKKVVETLGEIGDEEVVDPLIAILNDDSKDIRASAATALMNIKDRRSVTALVGALRDPYRDVRRNAARALLKMPIEAVNKDLSHHFRFGNKKIDEKTIEALVEVGDPEAVNILISLSINKKFRNKIIAALLALDQIIINPLIQTIESENAEIRYTAAFLLGKIGTRLAIKPLIRLLKDSNSDVRTAAQIALQELMGELECSTVEELLERISN